MPAINDAAAGFARQLQAVIREPEMDVVRVDNVWLDTPKQRAKCAGSLRIPQ